MTEALSEQPAEGPAPVGEGGEWIWQPGLEVESSLHDLQESRPKTLLHPNQGALKLHLWGLASGYFSAQNMLVYYLREKQSFSQLVIYRRCLGNVG